MGASLPCRRSTHSTVYSSTCPGRHGPPDVLERRGSVGTVPAESTPDTTDVRRHTVTAPPRDPGPSPSRGSGRLGTEGDRDPHPLTVSSPGPVRLDTPGPVILPKGDGRTPGPSG